MQSPEKITQVIIHPAIGVARVGNSPDGYFLLPEVLNEPVTDATDFRDADGRIKRQAARFRLYGADAAGNYIRELTAADGDITWTVQVANKKAAWYDFDIALDIPQAKGELAGIPATQSAPRNAFITGDARNRLAIEGPPVSISGTNTNAGGSDDAYAFNKGTFLCLTGPDTPVYLGELRTDDAGRLLFLGGRGHSASFSDLPATTFADNDTWHDDTSDGPVDAVITLKDGRTLTAKGAWVLTAPPDYAPGVQAFVTGYDLLAQVSEDMGHRVFPAKPSFWEHIFPLLERMPLNGWVNNGIFIEHGWGSPGDLSNPAMIERLKSAAPAFFALRQAIFRQFRNPDYVVMQAEYFPPVYGDGLQGFNATDTDPRNFMAILPYQYEHLRRWADGDFSCGDRPGTVSWDDLSPAEQAHSLDRTVLDETIGGPFHPGCEFTWPLRHPMMYAEPMRLKRRADAPLNWGPKLNSTIALAPGGPLDGSGPGDLTKWMAVPWQTDTSSCLSGYTLNMGLYIPTFWPVRVPNDVLTEEDYATVMDDTASLEDKNAAFARREKWLRGIVYNYGYPPVMRQPRAIGINKFIADWPQVGIVVEKEGPRENPNFPEKIWVETGRTLPAVELLMDEATPDAVPQADVAVEESYSWMVERYEKRKRGR